MPLKKAVTFLMIFGFFLTSRAQEIKKEPTEKVRKHYFLDFKYQAGPVLPTNDFVQGDNRANQEINAYQSLAFRFGKQTSGEKDWEHLFNFPYYGVALYSADFINGDELGYPSALYGFMGGPFRRYNNRWSFNWEMGFGLTWNWQPYDDLDNPWNIAIGSYKTVFINVGGNVEYALAPRWHLLAGLSATHFSNGAMKKPNKGINLFAPELTVRYNLNKEQIDYSKRRTLPKYDKENEFYVFMAAGAKQVEVDTTGTGLDTKYFDESFAIMTLSASWMRQFGYKFKAGVGIDVSYDESINAQIDVEDGEVQKVDVPAEEKLSFGVAGNMEFIIHRLSVLASVGAYVWRKEVPDPTPVLYQRVGIKYHFADRWFVGMNVRSYYFTVADYIEWNLGYRIRWKTRK